MAIETKAQHTPGPWHAGTMSGDVFAIKKRGTIPVCAVPEDGSPNWEADARLIAAAPELLLALNRICDKVHAAFSQTSLKCAAQTLDSIDEIAKAAIAKAEGR